VAPLSIEQQNFAVLMVQPQHLASFYDSLSEVSRKMMIASIENAVMSSPAPSNSIVEEANSGMASSSAPPPADSAKGTDELINIIGYVDPLTIGGTCYFGSHWLYQI